MTGPIFIKGACPGDMLEVRLESVVPNRSWGWSMNMLAPNVVDPETVSQLPEAELVRWRVDMGSKLASWPESEGALGRLKLPVQPFLGCLGVAPPRGQAISTTTSGVYGGNMDFSGFTSGVVCYFPVFAEGALFHLGDGHAVQGDGELLGTGIEISMDVRLSFRIHKDRAIDWPRGETDTHLFCIGNARPLDQAFQHATSEMFRWLQQDYHLTAQETSLLLGQAAEYQIANLYNPAYSVACKIQKLYLFEICSISRG